MSNYDIDQLSRIEPAYLAELGLNEAPFAPHHDDAFLYIDAERAQRLNMLKHLTQYSNLLLIVTGERGVGKTSLLRRFVSEAEEDWNICEVNAHTMMDAETLLSEIALGFGLSGVPHDMNQVQDIVFEHLKALQNSDEIPILLIDDAHELPKEALETLFYFADIEAAQGHLLRIILFCEPQIEIMLEAPAIRPLRERITHTMDVPELEEEQTAEYIKHRMAVAGFEGTTPFTPKVIKKLHRISRGIPSHINELAHLHLDDSSNSSLNEVTPARPAKDRTFSHKQIALGSIIIIIAIIALTLQDSINDLFREEKPVPTQAQSPQDTLPVIETRPEPIKEITLQEPAVEKQAVPESTSKPKTDTGTESNNAVFAVPDDKKPDAAESKNEAVTATATPDADKQLQISAIEPEIVKGSVKPQKFTIKGEGFVAADGIQPDVIVQWPTRNKKWRSKTLATHQVALVDDNTLTMTITTGTNPHEWKVTVKAGKQSSNTASFYVGKKIATQPDTAEQNDATTSTTDAKTATKNNTDTIKPVSKPPTTTYQPAANWIMSQDPAHFTLQLIGTQQRNSLERFVAKHKLVGDVSIYKTLRDDKPWYALVYGSYPDRAQAQAAAKQLPASLAKVKPWLRRFDSVQAQIVTETKPIKATRPKASSTTKPDKQNHDAWLWSQDPRQFTLQLLGSRNEAAIKRFIKANKLLGQAKYFHTRYDTRDWYTLVYGVYPSRAAATKAIKDLPPALQNVSPWARSFASIHKDLHQSKAQ